MEKVKIIIFTASRQEVAMILEREACAMGSSDTEHTREGGRVYRRNLYASDGNVVGVITVK